MTLLERYTTLNNSFEKILVFHVGADSGFFSEYNNMLIAMVYCLENKIRFTIYSRDANFGFDKGWKDYFLPFCEEKQEHFHHYFNFRQPLLSWKKLLKQIREKKKIMGIRKQIYFAIYTLFKKEIQKRYRFDYLTYELWALFYNKQNERVIYHIPELGIHGTLREACRVMAQLTWRFNEYMDYHLATTLKQLNLPDSYIGLQIRGGDKVFEINTVPLEKYIDRLKLSAKGSTVFVLTDHFANINQLKNKGHWNTYTLCKPDATGYVHQRFSRQDKQIIAENISNLLCSVEILTKSSHFIGTYTANPSIFVGIVCPYISEDIENRSFILIDFLKIK